MNDSWSNIYTHYWLVYYKTSNNLMGNYVYSSGVHERLGPSDIQSIKRSLKIELGKDVVIINLIRMF